MTKYIERLNFSEHTGRLCHGDGRFVEPILPIVDGTILIKVDVREMALSGAKSSRSVPLYEMIRNTDSPNLVKDKTYSGKLNRAVRERLEGMISGDLAIGYVAGEREPSRNDGYDLVSVQLYFLKDEK